MKDMWGVSILLIFCDAFTWRPAYIYRNKETSPWHEIGVCATPCGKEDYGFENEIQCSIMLAFAAGSHYVIMSLKLYSVLNGIGCWIAGGREVVTEKNGYSGNYAANLCTSASATNNQWQLRRMAILERNAHELISGNNHVASPVRTRNQQSVATHAVQALFSSPSGTESWSSSFLKKKKIKCGNAHSSRNQIHEF